MPRPNASTAKLSRLRERQGVAQNAQASANDAVAGMSLTHARQPSRLDVLRREDVWAIVGRPSRHLRPTRAELAAVVAASTSDVSGDADDNALQRAYRQLLDELGRGYDPSLSYDDHVAIVEVTSDTGTFSVLWLAQQLRKQVAHQRALLSERDREIFEHHLLTRVSEALRELLNDADELVDRINRSLAQRPTASGKSVQLRWEASADAPSVRSALALLRKSPELLAPTSAGSCTRSSPPRSRSGVQRTPHQDTPRSFASVLDYRSWHAFVPCVRSAGGGIQRLQEPCIGACPAASRQSCSTFRCSRLPPLTSTPPASARHVSIALDEAFAGIDEGMRGELMGLLVRFDLDILLTGHELWALTSRCRRSMVYDLLRQPPLEGVSAFAVRWDGAAMAEV